MKENNFIFGYDCPIRPGGYIFFIEGIEIKEAQVSSIEIVPGYESFNSIDIMINWNGLYINETGKFSLEDYRKSWFCSDREAKYALKYLLQDKLHELFVTEPNIFNEDNDE